MFKIKNHLFKRLLPIYIAVFAQTACLWVATEKLFMTEIGFDAASMGLMAAIYAAFVPFVEVPSGILADRWSRRGVLILASTALFLATLIGGLSQDVPTYIVSALVLGIFFAMASGTFEAIIYDTVLEETGKSKEFEDQTGKYRLFMSTGGLLAALAGGALAAATSPRITYFISLPIIAISVFALLKFREPLLHKAEVAVPWRSHIKTTYKVLLHHGRLVPIIGQLVIAATLVQLFLEFGSIWLIAVDTPVTFYGVAFGFLIAASGFAGLLAGKIDFSKLGVRIYMCILMLVCGFILILVTNPYVLTLAQIALSTGIITVSILFTRLLHDSVSSNVRAGVASSIGALSWILFVPVSLLFGWLAKEYSIFSSAWLVVGLTIIVCLILVTTRTSSANEVT